MIDHLDGDSGKDFEIPQYYSTTFSIGQIYEGKVLKNFVSRAIYLKAKTTFHHLSSHSAIER